MTAVLPLVVLLPTLDQVRTARPPLGVRLPIPSSCTCAVTGFECEFCFRRADAAFERSQDV